MPAATEDMGEGESVPLFYVGACIECQHDGDQYVPTVSRRGEPVLLAVAYALCVRAEKEVKKVKAEAERRNANVAERAKSRKDKDAAATGRLVIALLDIIHEETRKGTE